jgi:probable non-F420 flavinoid oxidoreductase
MAPVTIGLHHSHEQHAPSALLHHARLAAAAGFKAGMCSDHFHPWSERQGHSGYTWSWLGAALASTPLTFGTVCAPGQRYHPAIIAQAAATLAEMYPDRLWLALGSGEALNEAITGDPWPSKADRNARLRACVDVMRALWAGETVTTTGHVTTVNARLFSRPSQPPLLVGAALTPETATWVGSWADAMITVSAARDRMREVIDAFRQGGGVGKPIFLQVTLSFAPTEAEAADAAYDQWRHCVLSTGQLADVTTAAEFDRLSDGASPRDVVNRLRVSADIERHLAWLQEDAAMGIERIYVHNIARAHQERFIDACGTRVLPAFARAEGARRQAS